MQIKPTRVLFGFFLFLAVVLSATKENQDKVEVVAITAEQEEVVASRVGVGKNRSNTDRQDWATEFIEEKDLADRICEEMAIKNRQDVLALIEKNKEGCRRAVADYFGKSVHNVNKDDKC